MDRAQKAEQVEMLKGIFSEAGVVVVAHYSGLNVAEMTALRGRLAEAGAQLKVVKNRLAKIALADTPGEGGRDMFEGPVAIAFAPDPVAVSKAAVDYAKENELFVLRGGILGATVIDEKGIEQLAKMPSLDELRAKLAGVLNQPATKLATVLDKPAGNLVTALDQSTSQLVSVLNARKAQLEAA